jgi:glycosyltransferase involved in cell wall biosynthesis
VNQPLVSVVTPFHNTAAFLSSCIESVLGQSYAQFEYILVDNCSTDGSGEIAETYARRDSRIRLIRRAELLSQVQNYNGALAEISDVSKYCKIVQADDYIFSECLTLMVRAFEQSDSIGLVSAYDLKADVVRGSGFPWRTLPVSGKETARLYLRKGIFPFGSPTTVMYRSSLVRGQDAFYDESRLHEDTEKCMQILEKWDFAFVPQVLSFLRADNESISSVVRNFQPDMLDRYIIVQRYAAVFLDPEEVGVLKKQAKRHYYQVLAHAALHFRGSDFWRYHEKGLKTLGEKIEWLRLILVACGQLLWMVVNPGKTVSRVVK